MKKKYLIIAGIVTTILAVIIVSCILYKKNYYRFSDAEITKSYLENNYDNIINYINNVDMETLSKYLIGRNDRDNVIIEYLRDTDNIELTFYNIESAQYKGLYIVYDKDNNSLFLRNANLDSSIGDEDSLVIIPINEEDTYVSLCTKIFEYVDTYENVIINNLGDNVNYGEDVGVIMNEDGTYRLDINS